MSETSPAPFKFKIALCQVSVGKIKTENLEMAKTKIESAVKEHGVKLVMLPECFNCPYGNQFFEEYAEDLPNVGATLEEVSSSPSVKMLCETAEKLKIYIVGGSIPERSSENGQNRIFNTSIVVSPKGDVIAKHRKVHLFDIDVPGGIRFMESDTLSPGKSLTTFNMKDTDGKEICKIGVAICYDIRFPEFSMLMADEGCSLICIPGAFNMTTGPAHWELLGRARALDNQLYVAMCSPARDDKGPYTAWGHSSVIDPWGAVIATTEEREDTVVGEIDQARLIAVRKSIPIRNQKRNDIYELNKSKL
eukprot:CAMPEP_0184706318 /NCGR_PEP_ID=MMETSP0313-20130426/36697_1 /TAXON_ID=2792 /ORGANISM="Porphyridium aerugineum, Strain SAG 1380-2" /LENGTH=305 /DNA_ID=CAMNT_0027167869 /DNA_START=379 /DNA_END=1296 /DNA_ORIENTATION=-